MRTQNVTLALPRDTLLRAKLIAVQRQTSLSRLLRDLIEDLIESEERYELAKDRHLDLLERGLDLGTDGRSTSSREELHER